MSRFYIKEDFMKEIIVVIATKNRPDLFALASGSVSKQTKKPSEVIVTSDSTDENKEIERSICLYYGFTFIEDKYTHNYAGNLNTAIDYIIKAKLIDSKEGIKDTYIAFLDDDDTWDYSYLEKCSKALKEDTDFVVAGLFYETDEKRFPLDIPVKLTKKSFLGSNPHIQGSNTFVKMTTLLKAGCFDENMSSTTDRDVFTRIMMLNPKYEIVREWLVNVDAKDARPRLTNTSSNKKDSFAKFYAKYGGLMDDETKAAFFERTKRYAPIKENDISIILPSCFPNYTKKEIASKNVDKRIVFAFVTTDETLAVRMIKGIKELAYPNKKILCVANYQSPDKYEGLNNALVDANCEYSLKTIDSMNELFEAKTFNEYVNKRSLAHGTICDIAAARTILHYYAKEESNDGDIIWILDDDMEFFSYRYLEGALVKTPLDIKEILSKYNDNYDVVVGAYSNDAPLPSLSVIRTSLLDYTYAKALNKNSYFDSSVYRKKDYYYDLTDEGNIHLETPLKVNEGLSIDDVFLGKATSRPLFETGLEEYEPNSRGGNTLIFNREVLDIPNMSIVLGSTIARRSDYFWTLQAKKLGYKVIGSSFTTFHNRTGIKYDYKKEIEKELKDLIGSSFTKAYSSPNAASRSEFCERFSYQFKKRLTRLVANYYRVVGLLSILGESSYSSFFNECNLSNLIRMALKYTEPSLVESSFDYLNSIISNYENSLRDTGYRNIVNQAFKTEVTKALGIGNEGIVFADEDTTYKVFYSKIDTSIYEDFGSSFSDCPELFPVRIKQLKDNTIIYYPHAPIYEPYNGGYAYEVAELIRFLKDKGLVLTNIKRTNFLLIGKKLKFIDYGKNIERFEETKYQRSVERAYQMLRYPFLSMAEYKQMISMSYMNDSEGFNFGLETFKRLVEKRYKEQIHDPIIVSLIKDKNPKTLLDYGAGKCRIANAFSNKIDTYVYDIDIDTMEKRANKDVHIIKDIEAVNKTFDFINCNLVLCCTDKHWNEYILNRINALLEKDGTATISLCSPFFENIEKTETKRSGYHGGYCSCQNYHKKDIFVGREEYHRPFSYYERLLHLHGFKIEEIKEDGGINIDTINPIGEHLFFVCKKKEVPLIEDCSLLIKTNPMEHASIHRNVVHIVNQLEKNSIFKERVLIVDEPKEIRARRYDDDDENRLNEAITQLMEEGYLDRVVYSTEDKKRKVFSKWFKEHASDGYAKNGQQILASLIGLDSIRTRYVFQTDSDILYFNDGAQSILGSLRELKKKDAITLSLSIASITDGEPVLGKRLEVRSSFIDLEKLNGVLPIDNPIEENAYTLPWHRALDKVLKEPESIRLVSKHLFFIHPENETKKKANFIAKVRSFIEKSLEMPSFQIGEVNLKGDCSDWTNITKSDVVVFVRGKDTEPEKLKRLFDSLIEQKLQDYELVYFDDSSEAISSEYARMRINYDSRLKDKTIAFFNDSRAGSLSNFDFFYKNVATNPNSIIVNVDSDDCFMTPIALSEIKSSFDKGYDVTVGGCFRFDKPLRKYEVESFDEVWERGGDNIWLHPKCFKRYLCNYIQDNLLMNGKFIDVSTDYAMMLPIIEHSKRPKAIEKLLYFFEPSLENVNRTNKYSDEIKGKIKTMLLERAKEDHMKKTIAVIGDSNIARTSEEYELAYELGKALVDNGYKVQTGGLGGVMEAALKGAKSSNKYVKGDTIAILPSLNEKDANDYADVIIPTGLDILRNGKVVDADAVISLGGGAGTLSEIAMAWQLFRLIISFDNFDGWSKKLANTKLDERKRYPDIQNDRIYGASSVQEAIELLKENIGLYIREHTEIKWRKPE